VTQRSNYRATGENPRSIGITWVKKFLSVAGQAAASHFEKLFHCNFSAGILKSSHAKNKFSEKVFNSCVENLVEKRRSLQ